MKNFARVLKMALRHRLSLTGAIACSLLLAMLWGANIGTIYPFVEVVFRGESMHDWVDGQIETTKQDVKETNKKIAALQKERDRADAKARASIEQDIAFQKARLAAEEKSLEGSLALRPHIKAYLPDDAFLTLVGIVVVLLIGTVLKDMFLVGNMVLVERVANRTTLELRSRLFARTLDMELGAFGRNRSAEFMSRIGGDTGLISGGLNSLFGRSIREPLKMVACIGGAAFISWRLLVLSLIVCPIAVYFMYWLAKAIKRANRRALEETALLFGRLAETIGAIPTVKAYTMEQHESRRFSATATKLYSKTMRIAIYGSLTRLNNELLGIVVVCLSILAGGYLVLNQETHLLGVRITDQPLSFGGLMLFYALLIGAIDPARKLSEVFSSLQGAAAASDRVFPLLDRKPTMIEAASPVPLPEDGRADIDFENVEFHYEPGEPVLHDVTLHIRQGETLAIVGPNGCGKSTLANLMLRFYDPTVGVVKIGGVDLRELSRKELRRHIGLVTQQPMLFDDSIADNIRYGSPDAAETDVIRAAQKAHAHTFIEKKEGGYNAAVGERGRLLSGGQQQRICLARAILRDPAILILDEATSQIDPESEQLIHRALADFARDRTTILITHRRSTLDLADRILVMEHGRIVDIGSHDDLLPRCEVYRRLYRERESA